MVIAVCSLAVVVDVERNEVRAAFGSAAPTARLVTLPLDAAAATGCAWRPQRVRSTTSEARLPTAAMRWSSWRDERWRGATA